MRAATSIRANKAPPPPPPLCVLEHQSLAAAEGGSLVEVRGDDIMPGGRRGGGGTPGGRGWATVPPFLSSASPVSSAPSSPHLVSIYCFLFLLSFGVPAPRRPGAPALLRSLRGGTGPVASCSVHAAALRRSSLSGPPPAGVLHPRSHEMKRATPALSRCVLHKATVAPCYSARAAQNTTLSRIRSGHL